jgi:hypothetical protein
VLIAVGLAAGWLLVRLSGSLLSRVLFDVTPATSVDRDGNRQPPRASLVACVPSFFGRWSHRRGLRLDQRLPIADPPIADCRLPITDPLIADHRLLMTRWLCHLD